VSKKVLIHSIVFSPDRVSTAYLYNDIALKLKDSGYDVSVLTTTPHYNFAVGGNNKHFLRKKVFGLYYESDFKGITVKHVYQKKYKSTVLRLLGFIYWYFVSFFLGLFEKKTHLIISPSPPLSIGIINVIIGKLRNTKLVYNVQEIYPDILIENGMVKSQTIICFLKWIEKIVYNQSDAVTTIDQLFYDKIVKRFKNRNNLHIIPNFVDTDIYKPLANGLIKLDEEFFTKSESLKLMYAGNIGHAQDWEPLIQLALELKNEPVEFFCHWFMQQSGKINGFTKAFWGGVTTLELAKVIDNVIDQNITGLIHITNGQPISKFNLIQLSKIAFNKNDVEIESVEGKKADKSLKTIRSDFNYKYPSYKEMIQEQYNWMNINKSIYSYYLNESKK